MRDVKSEDIVAFAREISTNRSPATVAGYMSHPGYMSHLSAVFAVARPAWGMELDQQAMKDAFTVCNRLGITGKARLAEIRLPKSLGGSRHYLRWFQRLELENASPRT